MSPVKTIKYKTLDPIWLKATAVGSIWASLEIIIGSFLHNINIPFSGTILSIMSVWLLIAFLQVWNERGIIWRAGLICALMKSISPSAVIIGPMTGIIMEAFLIELALLLPGRNLAGYITGGALAVMSSLLHKVVTLLILYGFDLVRIADSFYRFAVNKIGGSNENPAIIIIVVFSVYAIAGIAAASGGFLTGRRHIKNPMVSKTGNLALTSENKLFESSSGSYSVILLLANIIAMVTCMVLISHSTFQIASISSLIFATIIIYYYRNSLRRLAKWSIWIQFIIIAIASAFLWNSASGTGIFDADGLIAGGTMILRAVIIILGFAAISVELKNPLIKSLLYNRGLSLLYQALTLGFSVLPALISSMPGFSEIRHLKGRFISRTLSNSEELLAVITEEERRRPEIFIITGNKGEGKSTFTENVARLLKERGVKCTGFISRGRWEGTSRQGFTLYDLESGNEKLLCSVNKSTGPVRQGRFWFNAESLKMGERIISDAAMKKDTVTIIDEVGPLEIGGKGWYRAIEYLCSKSAAPQIWSVRLSMVHKAARRWNCGNIYIISVSDMTPGAMVTLIEKSMAGKIAGHTSGNAIS